MNQSPIASIFHVLSILAAIIGIIFFFINPAITIVCAIISVLNSIIQVVFGGQNNLNTEIATIIIAVIIALIIDTSIINIICFALCAADILMLISGWIFMLIMYKRKF